MTIRITSQGFEISAIIGGYLVSENYIGYSLGRARALFRIKYPDLDDYNWELVNGA